MYMSSADTYAPAFGAIAASAVFKPYMKALTKFMGMLLRRSLQMTHLR